MYIKILLIGLVILISSCGSTSWTAKYPMKDYVPPHPNAAKILKYQYTVGKIEAFNNVPEVLEILNADHLNCRKIELAPVTENMSIKEYLAEALINQLDAGGKFTDNAQRTINLAIKEIDLLSFDGIWNIEIIYSVGSKKYPIKTSHTFETSILGAEACNMAIVNFRPALEANFVMLFSKLSEEN